ncbi:uncharacterized protein F4807DRAFT_298598 [Annulohypoxylon truncatum]|uniref:uncharacterized protein n=1 Tax=Annulohypoxylon truncatum TaxID=327061 RepID=UPI002007416E|nr:uncharacterized protein F4807DRAFT_298598 [Annulohypoxylon truncatum]KAI1205025.1 hypothetical protein F4807DRAFT_298598 [Annulohypoxylon truncatum]
MESIKSLRISDEAPSLLDLPADILYIILAYLDTARSVAHLAATCKGLYHLVSERGWQIFVTNRFDTFTLSQISSADEWRARAQSLTSQSRDWDRHGFIVDSFTPVVQQQRRSGTATQSIPSNIIVDAHYRREGNDVQDLIFWGAGEDVFGFIRHQKGPKAHTNESFARLGELSGYHPGKDDVTCVSILKDSKYNYGQKDGPQVLVGRADGRLQLLSMDSKDFGKALLSFEDLNPIRKAKVKTEIQSLDVNYKQGLLAAATKNCILNYSLDKDRQTIHNATNQSLDSSNSVYADDDTGLKGNKTVGTFDFIRSVKFVNDNTLAVGLNKGPKPLQFLEYTPTGAVISHPTKTKVQDRIYRNQLKTVRAILPVDISSLTSGGGNAVLSSWDDGTVRLQDLRTPSSTDTIFQDNFEVTTPINALLTRGLEKFIAGSAHSSTLKVFDYRWPKGYYHTESLPCGNDAPYPMPRSPSIVEEPSFPNDRATCDHVAGLRCRWHALSRHDFYRPNFNMWLPPFRRRDNSPVYSLASPSDDSPTVLAGLSGILVEITPKSSPGSSAWPYIWSTKDGVHKRHRERVALIETGSGFKVNDVADIQRMPVIHQQNCESARHLPGNAAWRKRHRLDVWLQ